MKTIIAGSRNVKNIDKVIEAIKASNFTITEIVSGTARGVDRLGEVYGIYHKLPIKRFPAKWDTYGKMAGFLRNAEMAEYADALIAIWDGESKGTESMIEAARLRGLKTYVYRIDRTN